MNSAGIGGAWLSPAFIVTIVIITVCVIAGLKRGLIKTLFDLFGMLIAVILTVLISPYVASAMRNNPSMYNTIHSKIEEHVHLNFNMSDNTLTDYVDGMKLPKKVSDFLLDSGEAVANTANQSVAQINAKITDKLTDMAINCIAFIITLVIMTVLIIILSLVLNLVSKLPVLNMLNKSLGVAAGIVEAYLILSVIGVIIMAASTSEFGIKIVEQITANPILSFIYKHNLILMGITRFRGMLK